jgi:hypothetical protein
MGKGRAWPLHLNHSYHECLGPLRYETTYYCRDFDITTIDMVKTMCGEAEVQKLTSIPLSDSTVKQIINTVTSNQEQTDWTTQTPVSCEGRNAHALTFVHYTCRWMLFTRTYCLVSWFPSMKRQKGCSVCCVVILTKNRLYMWPN